MPIPLPLPAPIALAFSKTAPATPNARLSIPLNLLGAIYGGAVHNDSFVVFTAIMIYT